VRVQGVEGGRVEASHGLGQQPDAGAGQRGPDEQDILLAELSGAVERGRYHVAEREKRYGRGNDEEGNFFEATAEAGAQGGGDFGVGADGAGHGGQFGGRDRHSE
jgi:hypothetical protein